MHPWICGILSIIFFSLRWLRSFYSAAYRSTASSCPIACHFAVVAVEGQSYFGACSGTGTQPEWLFPGEDEHHHRTGALTVSSSNQQYQPSSSNQLPALYPSLWPLSPRQLVKQICSSRDQNSYWIIPDYYTCHAHLLSYLCRHIWDLISWPCLIVFNFCWCLGIWARELLWCFEMHRMSKIGHDCQIA